MVQLYLIHYQKGRTEEILDNLASEENDYFSESEWETFKHSSQHSNVVNRFFSDLNELERDVLSKIKKAKKVAKAVPASIQTEILKVVKLARSESPASWDSIEVLLTAFSSRFVEKKITDIKDASQLEVVRLNAIIYLCMVFNAMGLFETSYAGESMLDELKTIIYSQSADDLMNMTMRLKGIMFG